MSESQITEWKAAWSGSTKQDLKSAALDRCLLHKTGKRWDAVPMPNVKVNQLEATALTRFRENATRARRLDNCVLGLNDGDLIEKLYLKDNKFLKRAAILLFHPDPGQFFTAASIKIGYFESQNEVLFHDEVRGNLFTQARKSMDLLMTKYLKAVISYEGIQRIETYPVPLVALKEALLNAIVHRDYAVPAQIQIRVYQDRLHIWNPGELPEDWSVEKLLDQHSSRPYNPDIANAFFQAGEIESWGRGVERIFEWCRKETVPEPAIQVDPHEIWIKFRFADEYLDNLVVRSEVKKTIKPGDTSTKTRENQAETTQKTTQETQDTTQETQNTTQKTVQETTQKTTQEKIVALLRERPELTRNALAVQIGITSNGVKYHLDNLKKAGRIQRIGSTKKGCWKVTENDSE